MFFYNVELFIIMYYWVKVLGSCMFLEEYSTKRLGIGISVYFNLSVSPCHANFKMRLFSCPGWWAYRLA